MLEMIVQVAPSNGSFCHPSINVSAEVKQKEDVSQKFVSMQFSSSECAHIEGTHFADEQSTKTCCQSAQKSKSTECLGLGGGGL